MLRTVILASCLQAAFLLPQVGAQSFQDDFAPLVESSCIGCHDAGTETGLDFGQLTHELSTDAVFKKWETIFDRVNDGSMPPESETRPDEEVLRRALKSLRKDLEKSSRERQAKFGRVGARRITKLEYGYTVGDLFSLSNEVASGLPDESESGSFDTVGDTQRISGIHMRAYLAAADQVLGQVLDLKAAPPRTHVFDFVNSPFLNEFHDKALEQGGNVSRRLEDGVALFRDVDYLLTSNAHGFFVRQPGRYRITSKVEAFQAKSPVTMKLILKQPGGGARLLNAVDLLPGPPQTVTTETRLDSGDFFYLTLVSKPSEMFGLYTTGAKKFKGKGLAVWHHQIEGPLNETWPRSGIQRLMGSKNLNVKDSKKHGRVSIQLDRESRSDSIEKIIGRIAPLMFRRPPAEGELEPFVDLVKSDEMLNRDFVETVKVPLRSMLSSPQFLMFDSSVGKLDDFALANRLSYFLWKSMPDEVLFELASDGRLSDPDVLGQQIDRMLADPKSDRFVKDFLGQWLQLYQVNLTTPDEKLFPEFDELLGNAIPLETEFFFKELLVNNLRLSNIIDSDFTFLNRRLAEHYKIRGVKGLHFRRVELPEKSVRGGVLTQAALLKTTANGTVTSPVTRGNFVLTNLYGTPPSAPPPSVGSIEPDTRGKTTIREILAAHRDNDSCNKCHREIDPPGFALESFDPIGGFRSKYRANKTGYSLFGGAATYKFGPNVDASGVTPDGKPFSGIEEYKQLLMDREEQIAKNFISKLVVYSTGAEIQFADRDEIEAILKRTGKSQYRVKDIIHEVIQSKLFRYN